MRTIGVRELAVGLGVKLTASVVADRHGSL